MAKKKVFEVPVTYIFSGTFYIRAMAAEEAELFATRHCGLVLGGGIRSVLPDEDVDWDFPCHPEKTVGEALRVDKYIG